MNRAQRRLLKRAKGDTARALQIAEDRAMSGAAASLPSIAAIREAQQIEQEERVDDDGE